METLGETLTDALVLGDTLVLAEGRTETLADVLGDTLVDALTEGLTEALVDVLGDTLAETLIDALVDTLTDVLELIEILGDLLTEGLGKMVIVEHTQIVPAALVVPNKDKHCLVSFMTFGYICAGKQCSSPRSLREENKIMRCAAQLNKR